MDLEGNDALLIVAGLPMVFLHLRGTVPVLDAQSRSIRDLISSPITYLSRLLLDVARLLGLITKSSLRVECGCEAAHGLPCVRIINSDFLSEHFSICPLLLQLLSGTGWG